LRPALAVAGILLLSGCQFHDGILAPAGLVAERQLAHFQSILLWMLPVVVPIFLAQPVILWRYRLGGRGRYTPRWEFNWGLELLLWGLPIAVVCVLSWNLWHETRRMDPYRPLGPGPALQVQAIAWDWKWLFIYPGAGIAAADRLVLTADRPVTVHLTSGTVLQSFAIPRLGGQIYAMPAMATEFNLRTGAEAEMRGATMQYNGDNFSQQSFDVAVVSAEAFEAWLEDTRSAPPLDAAALAELEQRATLPAPRLYGSVEGEVFHAVMRAAQTGDAPSPEDGS